MALMVFSHTVYRIRNRYPTLESITNQIVKLTPGNDGFGWKVQKKVQSTHDLKDDTKLFQVIRLPRKNNQGCCDRAITRTQASIVRFPEDQCTTFQAAKIHTRMIRIYLKFFKSNLFYLKKSTLIELDQVQTIIKLQMV